MKLKPWEKRRAPNEGRGEGELRTPLIFHGFSAPGWTCSSFGPSQSDRIPHVYSSTFMVASSQKQHVILRPA